MCVLLPNTGHFHIGVIKRHLSPRAFNPPHSFQFSNPYDVGDDASYLFCGPFQHEYQNQHITAGWVCCDQLHE